MARVTRVFALLELLRAVGSTTVAAAAARLHTSRRTILRDVATLREAGWPIHGEAGPGGGLRLDRDRGVVAVHLRTDEVAALWLAAQLSASVSTLPFGGAAKAALDKLFASLPTPRARSIRQLVRRVVIGRPASARILADLGPPPAALMAAFERAFADSVCLAFNYRDRHGRSSARVVEPHGLLVEAPAWYLLTRDTASGEARMFRMDRIRAPRVLPERGFVPDFDRLKQQALEQRQARPPER